MLERLARLGYASKALIYLIVGGLAGAAALGAGGRVTDSSGALRTILSQPFGPFVLLVLGVGLIGYATWRVLDAIRDPERRGHDFQAVVIRIGNVVRAAIYGALGVEALRLARGLRKSSGQQAEVLAARVMTWPVGEWLLGITGLIVAAYGVSQVVTATRGKADEDMDLSAMSSAARKVAINISRFGIAARGVIVVVLGTFLVRGAWQGRASEVAGTRESVIGLATALPGPSMLAAIALGFIAYGFDQAMRARFRRIAPIA